MTNVSLFRSCAARVLALVTLIILLASCSNSNPNPYGPGGGQQQQGGNLPPNATIVNIPLSAADLGPNGFGQNPLVIKVGTEIAWVNRDEMTHTSTSNTNIWDSGNIEPGQFFSFKFNTVGTFPYFCTIHGAASMSGVIQVEP